MTFLLRNLLARIQGESICSPGFLWSGDIVLQMVGTIAGQAIIGAPEIPAGLSDGASCVAAGVRRVDARPGHPSHA